MLTAALVFAGIAAAIHVLFFALESLLFDKPSTRKTFQVESDEAAGHVRLWAFNQGFYNLFLAIGAAIGIAQIVLGHIAAGSALVTFCCASMLGAALVLIASDRRMIRGALIQGTAPALAVLLLCLV